MKKKAGPSIGVWCLVVVVLLAEALFATAQNCSPTELSPCLPAVIGSQRPSVACCNKLREQIPCLCGYLRNPSLRQYVNSPGARRVASTCGVSVPRC